MQFLSEHHEDNFHPWLFLHVSLAHPLADEVQAALWSVQHLELNSSSFRATSHRTNVGLADA